MLAAVIADVFHTEDRLRSFGSVAHLGCVRRRPRRVRETDGRVPCLGTRCCSSPAFCPDAGSRRCPSHHGLARCPPPPSSVTRVGYAFGYRVGPPVSAGPTPACSEQRYLKRPYFERHGRRRCRLARFTPIVRTFGPDRGRGLTHEVPDVSNLQHHRRRGLDNAVSHPGLGARSRSPPSARISTTSWSSS